MAIDFSPLQKIDPAGAFFQGQQDVRAETDRNMLRQMQAEKQQFERENMLAQRSDREALAAQRRAQDARAVQRQQFLTGAAEALAQGGATLDRPTLMKVLQSGVQADEPTLIQFAREGLKALDEEDLYQRETARLGLPGAATPAAPAMRAPVNTLPAAPAAPVNMFAGTLADIGTTQPAPVNALAAPPAAAPSVTREMVQQMLTSPSARIREQGKALLQTLEKPERPYEPTEVEKLTNALRNAPPGSPEAQALQARIRILTTREPKEPKEPAVQPPIAVVDDATGRVKYVTREEALGKTPAAAIEGLTPKERQQREAKFPQATSAVKTFENTSNTLIKDLETLAKHPGLNSITGIAAGRLPGITSAGREAEALFDKIMARGGFQELQNMRQASPTGGALGNVSNQEGAQLRQAFAALDRRQDAASVRKAIADAVNQIRTSQQTIKDAYDLTYEYKQGGGAAPAAAPASPNIDALLNKYK